MRNNNFLVEIESLQDINKEKWNEFIKYSSEATYFCSTDYLKNYDNVFFFLMRNSNDNIIAGVPLRLIKFFPILGNYFKVCWIESGVLVSENLEAHEITKIKDTVLEKVIEFLKKNGAIYIYITHWIRSNDYELFKKFNFIIQKHATFVIDLKKDNNCIEKKFSRGFKRAVKKGILNNVDIIIEKGTKCLKYIEIFSDIREQTQKRAISKNSSATITLKNNSLIKNIMQSELTDVYIALAFYNNQLAYSALYVSLGKNIFGYIGGSNYKLNKSSGAANLLHHKLIFYFKEKGFELYDLGGTALNPDINHPGYGTYQFKKSFGGEYRIYTGGELVLSKIRGNLFKYFIKNRSLVRKFLKYRDKFKF